LTSLDTYHGKLSTVAKSGVVTNLLSWADFKQSKELKKTDGSKRQRLTGLPKLEDANDAGGRNSEKCTLILTEGDSAKALAVSKKNHNKLWLGIKCGTKW
jgi:DNA topoisomerase II